MRACQHRSGIGRVSVWVCPPLRRTCAVICWSRLRVMSSISMRTMRLRSRWGVAGSFQSRGKSPASAITFARCSSVRRALPFSRARS